MGACVVLKLTLLKRTTILQVTPPTSPSPCGWCSRSPDYFFDAIQPPATGLQPLQGAVDNVFTAALGVPRSFPKTFLYAPTGDGGLGVAHLFGRFELRFVAEFLNSRNSLVRLIQPLWQHPALWGAHPEGLRAWQMVPYTQGP